MCIYYDYNLYMTNGNINVPNQRTWAVWYKDGCLLICFPLDLKFINFSFGFVHFENVFSLPAIRSGKSI